MVRDVVGVEHSGEVGGGGADAGGTSAQLMHGGLAQDDPVRFSVCIHQRCADLREHACHHTMKFENYCQSRSKACAKVLQDLTVHPSLALSLQGTFYDHALPVNIQASVAP